jgi:carbonic anhydrase
MLNRHCIRNCTTPAATAQLAVQEATCNGSAADCRFDIRDCPVFPSGDPKLSPAKRLSRAVESNVRWTVRQILETPEGRARLAEGHKKIVGAVYDVKTGRVKFLPPESRT